MDGKAGRVNSSNTVLISQPRRQSPGKKFSHFFHWTSLCSLPSCLSPLSLFVYAFVSFCLSLSSWVFTDTFPYLSPYIQLFPLLFSTPLNLCILNRPSGWDGCRDRKDKNPKLKQQLQYLKPQPRYGTNIADTVGNCYLVMRVIIWFDFRSILMNNSINNWAFYNL